MKKGIVILLIGLLFITACGKTTVLLNENSKSDIVKEETEPIESMEYEEIKDGKKVDVILSMVTVGDTTTIDDYISKLQSENPNSVYSVYDDEHYIEAIAETKRKEVLKKMKDKKYVDDMFKELFTNEQYKCCFISMDYNNDYSKFTFFVNKEAFNNSVIASSLAPLYICGILSDTFQGYSLINPSDRKLTVEYIDNDTKELIYSTDNNTK